MTDAITSASPLYRRARALGCTPMPLAAGEVATLKRRLPSLYGSALRGLAVLLISLSAVWALALVVAP